MYSMVINFCFSPGANQLNIQQRVRSSRSTCPRIRTRRVVVFDGGEDIPKFVLFPRVLPKDDQGGFVQEESLVLQLCPNVFVFHWMVVSSKPSDMRTWVFAETASVASPAIPGNLKIVSRNVAVTIWDSDAP